MDQQYTRRLEKIEAELNRWLPDNPGTAWKTDVFPENVSEGAHFLRHLPQQMPQALIAPGKDLFSRGGKRWRPLLMLLVCEALGGKDAALPLVPLVEFCHNASLIHDDIEDNSDERRGKPAVHIIHGVDAAINSGSFLYFLSTACIDGWTACESHKMRLYSLWAAYIRRLHLGQAIDIYWHNNFELIPQLQEYLLMCALKTGCLARFAAEAGILAAETAGVNDLATSVHGLPEAAEKLGIGFQILDDVKNLTVGIHGKKKGDDIAEGKKSLPILLFLQRRPEMREAVSRCFNAARSGGVNVPETEELIQELSAEGVLIEAENQGKAMIAQARSVFASVSTLFTGFTELLI